MRSPYRELERGILPATDYQPASTDGVCAVTMEKLPKAEHYADCRLWTHSLGLSDIRANYLLKRESVE